MNNKKLSLLFILIAVLSLLGIVSFTIAYFSSKTSFDNLFSSAYYKTRAVETFTSPDDWIPGSTTSKQLVIKNDGTINVKARVCISEEWISANNDNLPLMQNNESAAIINLANTSDWTLKKNCYEYNNILEPGDETNSFMESVTFNPNIVPDRTCSYINNGKTKHCESSGDGYDNATYILTLTVETIQAEVADEIWDEDKGTLYGIVKNEYKSNSGYAALYTGEHKDSFDREATNEIYYYKTPSLNNTSQGNALLDKINVLFAGFCWQMYRTTDTGGVKMLFNGIPAEGKCENNRSNYYVVSNSRYETINNREYYYSSSYSYESTTGKFKLIGDTKFTNYLNDKSVIGMYTCLTSNTSLECSDLYYIVGEGSSSNMAEVDNYSSKSINYATIENLPYNRIYVDGNYEYSPGRIGYMYNKTDRVFSKKFQSNETYVLSYSEYNSQRLFTVINVSDEVDYGNINSNNYTLIDPVLSNSYSNNQDLVGKYTFLDSYTNYSTNVYLIVGVTSGIAYAVSLKDGNLDNRIAVADTITDNGNNTYTLNNATFIDYTTFYNNSSYSHKYTCGDNSITCENPRYIMDPSPYNYSYIKASNKILIAKSREGYQLRDTLIVSLVELSITPDAYTDYKYTCNNLNSLCEESNLRMIVYYTENSYNYVLNMYFGENVTWDGTKYRLNSYLPVEYYTSWDDLKTHHYFCIESTGVECTKAGFLLYKIYNTDAKDYKYYYVEISNGTESITEYLDNLLNNDNVNSKDSLVKQTVESWYEDNLIDYDSYIEETIFCNDRRISDYGSWGETQDLTGSINFYGVSNSELSCGRITDQFSVNNDKAKAKYKIGLATKQELNLINNRIPLRTNDGYWLLTPNYFERDHPYVYDIDSIGNINKFTVAGETGVRPVISLKRYVSPLRGTGTMADPYVINNTPGY